MIDAYGTSTEHTICDIMDQTINSGIMGIFALSVSVNISILTTEVTGIDCTGHTITGYVVDLNNDQDNYVT